jgi:hypothetical protein
MKQEPDIVQTAKQIVKAFIAFLFKNLYFFFALIFINFLYKYLIYKFIEPGTIQSWVGLIFDLSFYPIVMIFIMYIVNSYYAGKKITDMQDIAAQGKKYFPPLIIYYIFVIGAQLILPPSLKIIAVLVLTKLVFVDQFIFYRGYTIIESIKASARLVTLRLYILFFVLYIISTNLAQIISMNIYQNKFMVDQIILLINIFGIILARFFVTIAYRELSKDNFYLAKM